MKLLITTLFLLICASSMAQTTKKPVSKPATTKPAAKPAAKPASGATTKDTRATYSGGQDSINAYFQRVIGKRSSFYSNRRLDTCILNLSISSKGKVTKATLVKASGSCPENDSLFIKSALTMPAWKPAVSKGTAVTSTQKVKIVTECAKLPRMVYDESYPISDVIGEVDESFAVEAAPEEVYVLKEDLPLEFVDESAEFPGGNTALFKYLQDNLVIPATAQETGVSGRVYLKFVIETDGSVSNVTVQRGIGECPECAKEAIRVVRAMPKWKPARNKGKDVKSYFNLPVKFEHPGK